MLITIQGLMMKKILSTLLTIAFATLITQSFDTHAMSQTQKNQVQRYQLQKNRRPQKRGSIGRKRIPAGRRPQRVSPIQKKSPVVQKQNTQINQQIKTKTEALKEAIEQKQVATTPQKKIEAEKNINILAQDLLASISSQRSFQQDIYSGYEQKQIEQAQLIIKKLTETKKKINAVLAQKEKQLESITSKGFIWNAAIKGKEAQYNALSAEIKTLKETLQRIDNSLQDQSVITGQAWSTAYKVLVGATTAGAVAAAANIGLYGSAGMVGKAAIASKSAIGAGMGSAASWIKEKGAGAGNFASWSAQYGIKAGSALFGLYNAYRNASNLYAVAQIAYNMAFAEEKKANPNLTPEQYAAAHPEQKAELDKKAADAQQKKRELDAAVAQADAKK